MRTFEYPVLLIEDCAGCITAFLVDDPKNRAAYAANARDCLRLLEEGVEYALQQDNLSEATLTEPELKWVSVDVLPQYKLDERVQPCPELITLRVPCVIGKRKDAAFCSSMPTLGLNFDFFEPKTFEELVRHFVRSRFQGATPAELSRFLAPKSAALDQISVRLKSHDYSRERRFLPEKSLPTLSQTGEPISTRRALAGRFDLAFGRETLVKELAAKLSEGTPNLLLVGETGVGKTTVMARVARECTWGDARVEENEQRLGQKEYRFWLTNASRIISGMKYLGQWEERCEELVRELGKVNGFLCVENLLDLLTAGGSTAIDSVGAFFLPFLERSELRMIAEATPSELEACRRLLPGLTEVFAISRVETFSRAEAKNVATQMETHLGTTLKVSAERGVGARTCELFGRFLPYQVFPGKAAGFMRHLFKEARRSRPQTKLTIDAVVEDFQRMTGLPSVFLRDDSPLPVEEVEAALTARVIDQPAACQMASKVITAFKAGMNDPQRPIAVLLFSGPTGVGKTALAKAIADYLFGSGQQSKRLIRLDMSEYSGPWAPERLLQRPNGEPSELVKSLRQQPFSVVLFDEIEKADPAIFDVLMNVFDEGRLSDTRGRNTFFRSSIIIITSNLGADSRKTMGFTETKADYERAVAKFFRPEFFNRIDAVIPFQSLGRESIRKITVKELEEISQREGLVTAGIKLRWTEAAVDRLAATGYDERYGARPLQRALERAVVAPIARLLAENPMRRPRGMLVDINSPSDICIKTD